jgi:transglutaminase-like putative cysteine protease
MSLSAQPDIETGQAPVRYRVRHASAYRYGNEIMLAHHLLHLSPRPVQGQRILAFQMDIDPGASVMTEHEDYFGNPAIYLEMHEPHLRLTVKTEMDIEVAHPALSPADMDTPWEVLRDRLSILDDQDAGAASVFAYMSPMIAVNRELSAYALPSFPAGRPIGAACLDLTNRIYDEFTFDTEATTIGTPVMEVLNTRRGVCQDFAHFQIACLRSIGLSARYVSGYLRTIPPKGQPRAVGADASHAWLSVWCGGGDWLDFDPTNGRPGSTDLIALAFGRDYGDVSPLHGVILGSSVQYLNVEVDVAVVNP